MRSILLVSALVAIAAPAAAQAVRFTSEATSTPPQDIAGCRADDAMWWCYSNRQAPERQFTDEVAEITRVDKGIRAKFTYRADPNPSDIWASGNRAIETGSEWSGDCDDLAFTALDYMAWDGYPPERMWRVGMIIRTQEGKVEHMVGVVETSDGQAWVVGDVNSPAYHLADFDKVYGGRAHVTFASRLDQGMTWKAAKLNIQ